MELYGLEFLGAVAGAEFVEEVHGVGVEAEVGGELFGF